MSVRRLVLTAAAMAAAAVALGELTPALPVLTESLAHPQGTVDRAGPDALVVAAAGLLAWLAWGWGAVGLALTAASALPGLLGNAARIALRPSCARVHDPLEGAAKRVRGAAKCDEDPHEHLYPSGIRR